MRYRETMPKSNCVHCCKAYFPDQKYDNKGRWGWACEWDEYDPLIGCRKGQCYYYSKEQKETKHHD